MVVAATALASVALFKILVLHPVQCPRGVLALSTSLKYLVFSSKYFWCGANFLSYYVEHIPYYPRKKVQPQSLPQPPFLKWRSTMSNVAQLSDYLKDEYEWVNMWIEIYVSYIFKMLQVCYGIVLHFLPNQLETFFQLSVNTLRHDEKKHLQLSSSHLLWVTGPVGALLIISATFRSHGVLLTSSSLKLVFWRAFVQSVFLFNWRLSWSSSCLFCWALSNGNNKPWCKILGLSLHSLYLALYTGRSG